CRVRVLVIDAVSGPQFASERQAFLIDVDCNDRGATDDLRGHDGGDPDRARTEHRNRTPGRWTESIDDRSRAGLNAASKRPKKLKRRVFPDLDHVTLPRKGVSREG